MTSVILLFIQSTSTTDGKSRAVLALSGTGQALALLLIWLQKVYVYAKCSFFHQALSLAKYVGI